MNLEEKIRLVSQCFAQKGIRLDSDWLNGCVEFFVDEDPSLTSNQLYQKAEEQWELSDLCDSGITCLPDTILNKKESQIINGTFPLQIQHLLDISESPYDQLQKLQNKEVEMGKEQPEFKQNSQKTKKKRMLKLELTDGFKTVSALEYTPVPCLTTKLTPGVKIILTGPFRCVNHILFLESKNVRLLGGEVTSLVTDNAYENVLRKKLNQTINPNPKTDYQEPTVATDSTTVRQPADNIPSIPMQANNVIQSNVISSVSHHDALDDFPDDEFLTDIDIDQIASTAPAPAQTSTITHHNQNHSIAPNRRSTLLFDDIDDNDFLSIDSTIEQMNTGAGNQNAQSQPSTANEITENINLDTSMEMSICDEKYRFKIRGINLVTIKQLIECPKPDRERRKHFLVKAMIDDIIQKARVSRGKWMLNVSLTDELSKDFTLEASFSSDVTDKLAGRSGREISHLHATRNDKPQVDEEIANTLRYLTDRLETLDTFMKLEFNSNAEHPTVIELIDEAPVLNRKLQEKIDYEKLN